MKHARAIVRLLLFVGVSFAAVGGHAVCVGVARLVAPRRAGPVSDALARVWSRSLRLLLGVRTTCEGTPPKPPFILVSNHLGYLDIVTLMAVAPATFVSRADLAHWPLLGMLAREARTIFVDRDRRGDVQRVNVQIAELLAGGRGIIFFPEGTSSGGGSVLPFRSSLLDPAVKIGHPVHYASLSYRTPDGSPPASQSVAWWGDMTFFKHFYGLLGLPGIEAHVVFGPDSVRSDDRHDLAARLHHAVALQLHTTLAPETAPCA